MQTFGPILVAPWLLVLVLTPLLIRLAHRQGWLDRPDVRKQHQSATPIVGGVSVFTSIVLGLLLIIPAVPDVGAGLWGPGSLSALAVGAFAMVAVGLYDDFRDMAPMLKLVAQVGVGALAWVLGFRIDAISLPFGWMISSGGALSFVMTVGWIVVVTNAFNLMDGMDGLASGVSIIVALTVFLLAHGNGATVPVIAALALSGALAGFLRFNLPPARIFLGDAGSMGIGFTTAVLSMAAYQKATAAVALVVPLLILGVPLLDMIRSAIRRAISYVRDPGESGLRLIEVARAMFRADRGHVHHLLLRAGWSVQQILVALYVLSATLGALGLWTRTASSGVRWTLWIALLAGGYLALQMLERRVKRLEADADSALNESLIPESEVPQRERATG